mmetsp:Transcript_82243/g.246501  ORF Transcript_82243/g.246501 Transcript_82243/m.246501 type:complete len:153 (+) Transcript_82243:481-939(+)
MEQVERAVCSAEAERAVLVTMLVKALDVGAHALAEHAPIVPRVASTLDELGVTHSLPETLVSLRVGCKNAFALAVAKVLELQEQIDTTPATNGLRRGLQVNRLKDAKEICEKPLSKVEKLREIKVEIEVEPLSTFYNFVVTMLHEMRDEDTF